MIFASAVIAASTIAVFYDITTRRIPNILTFGLIAFAIVSRAVLLGAPAAGVSILIAIAVIVLGSFAYGSGWLAGGDIKLLAGGAACFGYPEAIVFLLSSGVCGGVLALVVALRQRRLRTVVVGLTHALIVPGIPVQASTAHRSLPYGIAICGGAVLTAIAHSTPFGIRLPL